MQTANSLLYIFPGYMREFWKAVVDEYCQLEEIRLRVGKPAVIKLHGQEKFLDGMGRFSDRETDAYRVSGKELLDILNQVCHDSIYAFEDEVKQGFLTVSGGHRIGLAGQAVVEEDGRIRTMKHISSLNIRVSHEIKGVADKVLPFLFREAGFLNTLIISPPGCGKTTLLRDIIRQLSDGTCYHRGMTVGVVDERSEIAGSFQGQPQNDVGIRTDVLDACPKVYGMTMLIRSMAPQVIAIDELGGEEDLMAIRRAAACGCGLLATVHGFGTEELQRKDYLRELRDEGLFSRYIILTKKGGRPAVEQIYNEEFMPCCGL